MIDLAHVVKTFGGTKAVDDLSFSIKAGEVVGLLGPNGAGKTTTMRIMTGYLAADSGRVVVNEIDVYKNPVIAAKQIGYMPENNPLYKDMRVGELLGFAADLRRINGAERRMALDFAIESVDISEAYNRPVGELSKGFRQRVGLAAALLHKPAILILDEPTEGLDPNQRGDIRTLIKQLAKNHTIVISTHVMAEVEAVCNRLIIMNEGKLVADGTAAKLMKQVGGKNNLRVELEGNGLVKVLREAFGKDVEITKNGDKRVRVVITAGTQPKLSQLVAAHKWVIWEMSQEKQQLEEVFYKLTQ